MLRKLYLIPADRLYGSPFMTRDPTVQMSLKGSRANDLFRTMRLARVGRMAFNRGSRNPPRCTISFFLAERVTRLSEILRSAALCFCSLPVLQPVLFILPFRKLKIHSLIQCNTSLLNFEMIALHNFGSAVFSVVIIRLHSLHRLHTY